jgi:DNA invertase Pin-like site-specific DNA recombinase
MAIFAYGRVSTIDQSVENQKLEITRAGYNIDYWFFDQGVSGKIHSSQRPQFHALLNQIRDGETLIVTKLDRFGRDAQDVITSIKLLANRKIEVIILQLGKLDITSSAGKLMLAMLAAVAEMERDLLVERTQAGLERAKNSGKILGRPSTTTAKQRLEILDIYKKGTSISALSRTYGVSRATIMRIVKCATKI